MSNVDGASFMAEKLSCLNELFARERMEADMGIETLKSREIVFACSGHFGC